MKSEKKAILVVSFGTSHETTREKTIGAIEREVSTAYPDYEIRRAFTSGMILRVLEKRDQIKIDNVAEAMKKLVEEGFQEVFVQPTHVIPGDEYDKMSADVTAFAGQIDVLAIGKPLLYDTDDYFAVIQGIMSELPKLGSEDALVLMGHGSEHPINAAYAAMDYRFKDEGYPNVFVGTVEGYPDLEVVLKQVKSFAPKKVTLLPLMVVAGDHAVNDMASDEEDSWKTAFEKEGFEVECILRGLGEFPAIRKIYLEHIAREMKL
ncbi:MAG: sirohydrochlorin cobaltochelatase [Bacillota bacterium]|jgi:sirohydrochlorin cobaltochelatase|nr:sirohydrochlorin cobaltochelatase [Bacillota bacterium]